MTEHLAFDRASQRRFDENGFLHVAQTPISKEAVNDYYGREIPGWQSLKLEPDRVYRGYRPGAELARAAGSFNGLPLLKEHLPVSAEDLPEELRAGNLGTSARFVAPYLCNGLIIQDAEAIEALDPKDGAPPKRELSAAYRYDPVFRSGRFNGEPYDFLMENIRGNHVALVERGRAGADVVVADAHPQPLKRSVTMANLTEEREWTARMAAEEGLCPSCGGEPQGRRPMHEEYSQSDPRESMIEEAMGGDEGDELGARALEMLDSLQDPELAAFLRPLIEAALQGAGPQEDEDPDSSEIPPEIKALVKKKLAEARAACAGEDGAEKPGRAKDEPDISRHVVNGKEVFLSLDEEINAFRRLRAMERTAKKVAPLVGRDANPFAFDSESGILADAIRAGGMDPKRYAPAAYAGIVDALLRARAGTVGARANAALYDPAPPFQHLGRIRK